MFFFENGASLGQSSVIKKHIALASYVEILKARRTRQDLCGPASAAGRLRFSLE